MRSFCRDMSTFAAAVGFAAALLPSADGAACPATDGGGGITCSTRYYKISDEFNGLATSCAAVDQPSDPKVGLTQTECQESCDSLDGCDTVNFRWVDPNFDGQSTCYRKRCGDFREASCTLFSKHKERDVYTKACGAGALWGEYVQGDPADGLFAGVLCPDDAAREEVAELVGMCANGTYVEPEVQTCSARYFKLTDEFNGLSTNCPAAVLPSNIQSDLSSQPDPLLGLDQAECQAECDALGDACDTIEFRWRDRDYDGRSACYRRNCGTFDDASCSLEDVGSGRDVYTKACGVEEEGRWAENTIKDAVSGLFVAVRCDKPVVSQPTESDQGSAKPSKTQEELGITCDPTEKKQQEIAETQCVSKYYKISDESNGLATSCAAVDQPSDPVVGLDQSGCQAACDAMEGCDTVNFRWRDPNFDGQSTCYRKRCGTFKEASCTLFTKHKSRDVYTKACGAGELYGSHVQQDGSGLFAGVQCPDETTDATVADVLDRCNAAGSEPDNAEQSCTAKYYKISDEFNGLATSCGAVDQPSDPVVGLDQAGCQASCDALEGCDTINFRWRDPNFDGQSTCYRKRCDTFQEASCTLFSKHKERDVYTKACGSEQLWSDHVLVDGEGLFAGVGCPGAEDDAPPSEEKTCVSIFSTNRTNNDQCGVCAEWSDGSADATRKCLVWELNVATNLPSCREWAPSATQLKQKAEYNEWLQSRWSAVGVCQKNWDTRTECEIDKPDGKGGVVLDEQGNVEKCTARDQPCHGGIELGGVAGVLSAGWQMTFSTEEDLHVCTMCGRGTYGSCDDACAYRRNFFWSGYNLGRHDVEMNAEEVRQLYDAFVMAQPEETYDVPQKLDLTPAVQERIPEDHPLAKSRLPTPSVYSVINVNDVMVTVRDQLPLIAVGLMNAEAASAASAGAGGGEVAKPTAQVVLSTKGVKVFETCKCYKCPRGQFQDGLGETSCKSCQDILPGSDTADTGADGPQLCQCLTEVNDNFLNYDGTRCVPCEDVRRGVAAGPPGTCGFAPSLSAASGSGGDSATSISIAADDEQSGGDTTGLEVNRDAYMVSANAAGFPDVPATWVTQAECEAVRNGQAAAPPGECKCARDTYEINALAAGVTDQPVDPVPEDWITCLPCPSGSSTFNENARRHEYGKSVDNCYCQPDTYEITTETMGVSNKTCVHCPSGSSTFNDDAKRHDYGSSVDNCYCQQGDYAVESGCAACPPLQTSEWNSQSNKDCTLTEGALVMAIAIPVGVAVFSALLFLLSRRYKKKIQKLEQEKRRQMQEKVNEATEIVNHLAHPMVFLSAQDFLRGGKMVKHEEARANQTLITVDTMQELKGFKKTNTLIFFSHQWLAWAEPDPQKVQYNSMVSAMHELVSTKRLDLDRTYVWLDYTSIPQTHRGLQRLSINSLTNYAGACDYLIVVAPGRTVHADTGTLCDKKSYQDRAWCRAEQLAHGCRKGVENMYLTADGGGLEPVTWDWIKPSFKIFSGELTCCARGHDGMEQCDKEYLVTPVLGLYCELRALEKISCLPPEKKEILDFFREHEEEVFPQHFKFSMGVGKEEERELFGEILLLLDELDLKEDELEDDSTAGSINISKLGASLRPSVRKSLSVKLGGSSSGSVVSRGKKKRSSSKLGLEIDLDEIIDEWEDDGISPPLGYKKGMGRRRSSGDSLGSAGSGGSKGSKRKIKAVGGGGGGGGGAAEAVLAASADGATASDTSGGSSPPPQSHGDGDSSKLDSVI